MRLYLLAIWLLPVATLLAGCGTREVPVIQDRVVTRNMPVAATCVSGDRPEEVTALNARLSREDWDSLTTDQRNNLIASQALDRKAYGDRLTAATAGCQ